MPNCYQYLKDNEPVVLSELDDKICREVLKVEPDPNRFHPAFDLCVNLPISMGHTLQEIVADTERNPEAIAIAQWLLDNGYTTSAWWEAKR